MSDINTVFQRKKLSGWDDVEVKSLKKGDIFRVLVDNVPIITENGTDEIEALSDAFMYEDEWVVAYS